MVLFSYPSDFVVEVDAHCCLEIRDPGPQGSMFLKTANLKMWTDCGIQVFDYCCDIGALVTVVSFADLV
jgi:hypothetical protein